VTLLSGDVVGLAAYGDPNGRPVLAFHGAPACRLMYALADEPARALGLRLIAPDRSGYGLTPLRRSQTTLAGVAAEMAQLCDTLGLARVGVIGISGGAPYAVATAGLLGRRVSAMALVSPMGPLESVDVRRCMSRGHRWFFLELPRRRWLLQHFARRAAAVFRAAPVSSARAFAATLGPADRAVLSQPAARDALIGFTQEALRQGVGGAVADLTAYAAPWDVDLSAISASTSMWQGTADRIVPEAAALDLAARMPRCRLQQVDGAGHFWILAHAEDVLSTLARAMVAGNS
jgi:pimeloyl-ACP methyl ester carboxylesterase